MEEYMKKWKYIIFDMDGTLFDTVKMSLMAWMSVKDTFHYPICEEMCISLIGRTRQSAQEIFDKYMPKDWKEEDVYAHHRQFMMNYKKQHGPLPKTDLTNLFTTLKAKGYTLALCTSSKREVIDMNLDYGNWRHFFDVLVDGSMAKKGKPAPDIFLKACEKLAVEPTHALVLEDSETGIQAAYSANIPVICIPDLKNPAEKYEKMTTAILKSLHDVIDFVEKDS